MLQSRFTVPVLLCLCINLCFTDSGSAQTIPVVNFSEPTVIATENQIVASFGIVSDPPPITPILLDISVLGFSTMNCNDYDCLQFVDKISLLQGEDFRQLFIIFRDDTLFEDDEYLFLELSKQLPGQPFTFGEDSIFQLRLIDDETNNLSSGLAQTSAAESIRVFPNPFYSELQLNGIHPTDRILIHDSRGKLVRSFEQATARLTALENLPAGVYTLSVLKNTGKHSSTPIVKIHQP